MATADGSINHVSDTALMVAACRALETDAPDGFVKDPFAARLAGERGMAILQGLARPEMMQFGVGIRSHFIDELLLEALGSNRIETVLSLGCGLDTRPWRLDLPRDLRWIEVDFPEMLDYKEGLMSGETPRCRRERLTADLNDPMQRRTLYTAVGQGPAFMITEGLLMYLPAATVEALAAESPQESGIAHWMCDIMSTEFSKAVQVDTIQSVRNVQASDFLQGEQIVELVRRYGWETASRRSYLTDMAFAMERGQKLAGNQPRPAGPPPVAPDDPTGIHRFGRSR